MTRRTKPEVEDLRREVHAIVDELFGRLEYGADGLVVNEIELMLRNDHTGVALGDGGKVFVPTASSLFVRVHPTPSQYVLELAQSVERAPPAND